MPGFDVGTRIADNMFRFGILIAQSVLASSVAVRGKQFRSN